MKKLILTLLTGLFLAQPAAAINLEDALIADQEKNYMVLESSGAILSQAILLYYVGTSTEAVVTIASQTITAFAPAGAANADSTFVAGAGASVDLTAAAYDTIGELCDAIDRSANYGCVMLGAKRNDNTNLLRDQTATSGTNDLKGNRGFEVNFDTGNINGGGDFATLHSLRVGRKPASGKRLTLKECEYSCSGGGTLIVYGSQAKNERLPTGITNWTYPDTLEVFRENIVSVGSTRTFAVNGIGGITFAKDSHAVVSACNLTTVQVHSNYLRCKFEEK